MNRLEIMELAARQAGKFMLGSDELNSSTQKTGIKDFVTVADIKSQDLIRKRLKEHFPDTVILSEEDPEAERRVVYAPDFTGFVLDPIDGTYNFKRDMRESAVSIGYMENGISVAGVVFDPYRDELYKAELGTGAFRNGQPIHVSDQTELAGANIATSNGYNDEAAVRNLRRQIAIFEQAGVMPWSSLPGSAVLALVWVACGRIDAIHHTGFKPWDNAAALVICQEAGAQTLALQGGKAKFTDSSLLVGTHTVVEQLADIFTKLPKELLA